MRADELGEFLRSRRERLEPAAVGIPAGTNRRTPGLRREELAVMAGVGVSWLTRLEQGRANSVSSEVLASLATALRLSAVERAHLFSLGGVALAATAVATSPNESHRRLVDGLHPNPAYLLDHNWDMVAWNQAEADLFPLLNHAPDNPNLLRLFLDDQAVRASVGDWEAEVERLVRQFRAHMAEFPSPYLQQLSVDLRARHQEFASAWDRHDVAPLAPKVRVINHQGGQLQFDQHRLSLPDHPGWLLVVFVPIP